MLTHTQMVCDALVGDPDWQTLDDEARAQLWLAALLHDCGKPATTREEDRRIIAPNHAQIGAIIARGLLWRAGVSVAARKRICALIRWHMAPYHLLSRADSDRRAMEISLTCRPICWLCSPRPT